MSVPQLTQREWELVREMTSMVDIDVLSDNLERGGHEVSSDEELCELLGKVLAHVPYSLPAPQASEALSFDEVEEAGLDGTLRDM